MQKFVVVRKPSERSTTQGQSVQNQAKVQMSGYLKKKRNKVGGWRKMWFVLQNQLLLSYSSKEEYDKKLVSFKDVLNLVPGTIVRPLGGFRFTIETTTDTIFTFRCDDSKSCTNWITALVESLSMQGQCAKENGIGIKPKFNASLENIRQMRPKRIVRTSYSWDSICQSKNTKSPKIPIAQSTARILERTGLDLNKGRNFETEISNRARNFRLHDKRLLHQSQQSVEVNRINRMFTQQQQYTHHHKEQSHQSHQNHQNPHNHHQQQKQSTTNLAFDLIVATNTISDSSTADSSASAANARVNSSTTSAAAAARTTNPVTTPVGVVARTTVAAPTEGNTTTTTTSRSSLVPVNSKIQRFLGSMNAPPNSCTEVIISDKKRKYHKDNECFRDLNRNKMNFESSLENQIQRLTLKDSSGLMVDPSFQQHNNDIIQKKSNGVAAGAYAPQLSPQYNNDDDDDDIGVRDGFAGYEDDENGAGDFCDDSPMNNAPDFPYGPLNLQDAYETKLFPRLSASSDNVNMRSEHAEPIYAVVDLKNKYARRAKLRELEEGLMMVDQELHQASSTTSTVSCVATSSPSNAQEQIMEQEKSRERPKSIHVVTSDYEEVLNFSNDCLDKDDEDENENIYEPINIPEGSHHHHRHAMWKYFPRINIEALIEMTRSRKKDSKSLPVVEPQSPFSDIRRKFGNHRKSIKIRMKRFYSTKESPGIGLKERNAFSDDELDSQGATGSNSGTSDNSIKSSCGNIEKPSASYVFSEIEKYRRGEKQIFGSLSRLKKTRASLCLDDGVDGQNSLVTPKSACFQQELRRDVSKRTGSKKTVCHSKFYD